MPAAARHGDPIGHSPTMNWLVKGLIAGAIAGAAFALIVGTGGLAAAAIVGGAAAGGAGIGELMSTMSWANKEVCGALVAASTNVFTNGLAAARAHLDFGECSKHGPPAVIATGSGKVFINGWPAARVDDKTICSAVITSASDNVFIGGGTVQTDTMYPENLVPTWVHASLLVVGIGAAFVAGPVLAIGGLVGGFLGGIGGGWIGGMVFGEGSDGQKWSMLGGSVLGGFLGVKAAPPLWARVSKPTYAPNEIRLSQNSVSFSKTDRVTGDKYTYDDLVASMKENGWQGDPVDLVRMPDGKLTSMDNTRIAAAREANIAVKGKEHSYDEPLTQEMQDARGWGDYNTWGEAITARINNQSKGFGVKNPHGSNDSPSIKGKPK